jgi:nucleoside phosphorylase
MSILKSDFPIMEISSEKRGVVSPKKTGVIYSKICVMSFFAECINRFVKKYNGTIIDNYHSEIMDIPIYDVNYNGISITIVQAPVGSAFSACMTDFVYEHGVDVIIVCGSCGVLSNIEAGKVLIPYKALRDEGASYKYINPSRFIKLNDEIINLFKKILCSNKIDYMDVITWTTDGLYRETAEMINYRKKEGCQVVEMECASMAAVALSKNKKFGQILYSGDILRGKDDYDRRDFFNNLTARELLFYISVEAARFYSK